MMFLKVMYIFSSHLLNTKKVPTCISCPIQESFRIPTLILFETSNEYLQAVSTYLLKIEKIELSRCFRLDLGRGDYFIDLYFVVLFAAHALVLNFNHLVL